ncbi:MAG: DUF58 domain-containing protein [Halieaceae bacterium]|jgi:uncharacterized protein (DUF58 family)|nr:DUF58 domain-containing protein [Halieaceae bacterium]
MSSGIYTDTASLARLRHDAHGFSLLPRQPLSSLLSGRKRSRLRGRGLDFEELRHYRPGDDIRTMDWRVTNRTGKPHVRVFTEERDRPVILLVDQRLGMFFGSRVKMKSVVAAELAALAAWRVLAQGDRVGTILFNDTRCLQSRPSRSERLLLNSLGQLSAMNGELRADQSAAPAPGQLANALRLTERMVGHDYLVCMVSDFDGWDEACLASIKRMARHNDLIAALVFDPLEQDISPASSLVVSDGHYQLQVEPERRELGRRFQDSFRDSLGGLQVELRKHGMPVLPIDTVSPVFEQLRQELGRH